MNTLALRFPRQLALATLALLALATPVRAITYLDNLSGTFFSSIGLTHSLSFALPFTTDNSATVFYLNDITVTVGGSSQTQSFSVGLYSNNGGVPSLAITDGAGSTSPTTTGNYTYSFLPTPLQPDTEYWVVLANSSFSVGDEYFWKEAATAPDLGTWTSNTTALQASFNGGTSWSPYSNGAYPMLSVVATPVDVPEPSSYAALLALPALALACFRRRK